MSFSVQTREVYHIKFQILALSLSLSRRVCLLELRTVAYKSERRYRANFARVVNCLEKYVKSEYSYNCLVQKCIYLALELCSIQIRSHLQQKYNWNLKYLLLSHIFCGKSLLNIFKKSFRQSYLKIISMSQK